MHRACVGKTQERKNLSQGYIGAMYYSFRDGKTDLTGETTLTTHLNRFRLLWKAPSSTELVQHPAPSQSSHFIDSRAGSGYFH